MKCTMLLCRIVLLLIKIIAVQERLWNVIQDCNGWNQLPYIYLCHNCWHYYAWNQCLCLNCSLFGLLYKICLSVVFIRMSNEQHPPYICSRKKLGKCIMLKPYPILDRLFFLLISKLWNLCMQISCKRSWQVWRYQSGRQKP